MKSKLLIVLLLTSALITTNKIKAQGFIGNNSPTVIQAVNSSGTVTGVNVGIGVPTTSSTLEVSAPSNLSLKFDHLPNTATPYLLYYNSSSGAVTYGPPTIPATTLDFNCGVGTITVNGVTSNGKAWLLSGSTTTATSFLGTSNPDDIRICTNNGTGCSVVGTEKKMIIGTDANNGNVEIGWDGVIALPTPVTTRCNKFLVQNGKVSNTPLTAGIARLITDFGGAAITNKDLAIVAYADEFTDAANIGVASFADNSSAQNNLGFVTVLKNPVSSNNGLFMDLTSNKINNGISVTLRGNNATSNTGQQITIDGNSVTGSNIGMSTTITGDNSASSLGSVMTLTGNNALSSNIGYATSISGNFTSTTSTQQNIAFHTSVTGNSPGGNIGMDFYVGGSPLFNNGCGGVAYGNNTTQSNSGVFGSAYGKNTKNYGVRGICIYSGANSNLNSICVGVCGTMEPTIVDASKYYGVQGDLSIITSPVANKPYYAVYGQAPNNLGHTPNGNLNPGSSSIYTYAGYFEGDVFCANNYYYSDPKLKENITSYSGALDQLSKIPVKNYTFRNQEYPKMNLPEGKQIGLLSTDLKAVFPNLVKVAKHPGNDKDDQEVDFEAVNYNALIPVLVEAVQELNAKTDSVTTSNVLTNTIAAQQAEIADLSKQLADLKNMVSDICNNGCAAFQNSLANGNVSLSQSIPNPTSGSALINYSINISFSTAVINIIDNGGKLIRQFPLPQLTGPGSVTFDGGAVAAGTYNYSLIIDGRVYDTKSIVILKD